MKRILTVSVVGILTCILMITTMLTALADTANATVNGVDASVGSKVEYTLNLHSKQQDVVGIQMIFKFDTEALELKSVNLDNFPGATLNANEQGDGMIYFNCSILEGVDFSSPAEVAKLQFEVISAKDSDIVYYIQYLYDFDLVNIYDYTLTYTLTVDGETAIDNEAPVLGEVDDIIADAGSFDSGDFANNQEGTGSGIKPVATTAASNNSSSSGSTDNGGDGNTVLYVIGGVVLAVLIAVVVIAIVKRNKTND